MNVGNSARGKLRTGLVVIGRDERPRLRGAIRSALDESDRVVYVDSGSTDGSPELARSLGARVVEVDPSRPFSAARGRNEGFAALHREFPDLAYVQFLDGDSELLGGWLSHAEGYVESHPDVGIVCGGLSERYPDASSYHRMAEVEWSGSPGEIRSAGGNAFVRVEALLRVGGYASEMIAGEDPEICVRMRRNGYTIHRLDRPMAVHDMGMQGFRQWWRRCVRDGHAYAEILARQARPPEPYWVVRVASIAIWGGVLPAVALLAAWPTSGASLGVFLVHGAQWARIRRSAVVRGLTRSEASIYATRCIVGKLAEFEGVLRFAWNRSVLRRSTPLIEHKRKS